MDKNTVEYKDWLFVRVEPDSYGYEVFYHKTPYIDFYVHNGIGGEIVLPSGSWQIIGKGDAIDWEGIVEKEELFINGVSQGMRYKDYKTEDVSEWFNRCKDSKNSLLRSLDMEPGTTLILKKNEK